MTVFYDTVSNFHPYACDGPGRCFHCDRAVIVFTADEGTQSYAHHPDECALCADDSGLTPDAESRQTIGGVS